MPDQTQPALSNAEWVEGSTDSEEILLENTIFVMYYPIVDAKKHSLAAGKSIMR